MFLATSNPAQRLLLVSYIQEVWPAELQRGREHIPALLAGLPPGFRLLVDLGQLEAMHIDCLTEIGQTMELIGHAQVGLIVRVIPDPDKDIGLNILTIFHYSHQPRVVTCRNLTEAAKALSL